MLQLKNIAKSKFNQLFTDSKVKETIDKEDLEYIIGALKNSPLITPNMLKKFGIK